MQILLLLFFLMPFLSFSQEFEWAKSSFNGQVIRNMDVDKEGNIYSIGDISISNMRGFINKFDKNGNLLWEYQLQVNLYWGVHGRDVQTDSEGNCIAGFIFTDTLQFLGYTFIPIEDMQGGRRGSTLILKFDPNGNLIWHYIILRGGLPVRAKSITIDNEDKIYISGGIYDYINFPDTTYYTIENKKRFIAKLDKHGNYLWSKHSNGVYHDYYDKKIISIEGFADSTSIDNVTFYKENGGFLLFCADSNYYFRWAKEFKWTSGGGFNLLNKTTDKEGNILLTGVFEKDIVYDNDTILKFIPQYTGQTNYAHSFVIKIDSSGNFLWSITGHSPKALFNEGITADTSGNVFITGFFNTEITFENTTIYSSAYRTMFIAKYDKDGNLVWLTNSKGGSTTGTTMASDNFGNVYFGGGYAGEVSLGKHTISGEGVMVGKIAWEAAPPASVPKTNSKEQGSLFIYPNPSSNQLHIQFTALNKGENTALYFYDSIGAMVHSQNFSGKTEYVKNIDVSNFSSGVYFLNIVSGKERVSRKFVVSR